MKSKVLKIAIRQNAIIIPEKWIVNEKISEINKTTSVLLANAVKLGYTFSEDLLHKINTISGYAFGFFLLGAIAKIWTISQTFAAGY